MYCMFKCILKDHGLSRHFNLLFWARVFTNIQIHTYVVNVGTSAPAQDEKNKKVNIKNQSSFIYKKSLTIIKYIHHIIKCTIL